MLTILGLTLWFLAAAGLGPVIGRGIRLMRDGDA